MQKIVRLLVLLTLTNTCLITPKICISQDQQPKDTVSRNPLKKKENKEEKAKDDDDDGGAEDPTDVIEPLLSYNFSGGNKNYSGLTPVINYGRRTRLGSLFGGDFSLGIQPYAAGQISIKDSTSFVPALMLPGVAGIKITPVIKWGEGDAQLIWSPVAFTVKIMNNFTDTTTAIFQHNIKTGIGLSYRDWFQFGVQYTYGWHNTTSESEENFKRIFNKQSTDIKYLTIVLESTINKDQEKESILFVEWRGRLGKSDYQDFPNRRILSIGFRKCFDVDNIFSSKGDAGATGR